MANGRRQNIAPKKNLATNQNARSGKLPATKSSSRQAIVAAAPIIAKSPPAETQACAAVNDRVRQAMVRVGKKSNGKKQHKNGKLATSKEPKRDRVVLLVRDAYWLHVYWELTEIGLQRIEAALGRDWYGAVPILRLLDVSADDMPCASERVVRDIPVRTGVRNWYLEIDGTPKNYRVDIGYRAAGGRFLTLARSNIVNSPKPGRAQTVDEHWESVEEDCERIFALTAGVESGANKDELRAMLEERLQRPLNAGSFSEFGRGALDTFRPHEFNFNMDAELIVHGRTVPHARVTLEGEPINIRADGSFTLRYRLPDGRQVLPVVAQSSDGIEERTIILAIERNTKLLEPTVHDGQE